MTDSIHVASELPYGKTGTKLLEAITNGVAAQLERTPESVTATELSEPGWDEFHVGGADATLHAVGKLDIQPGDTVLDIGCAIGGPARRIALKYPKCTVVGMDMTTEYISAGKAINEWENVEAELGGRVHMVEGDVTNIDFAKVPRSSIDKAYCIHVAMNIKDKEKLARELFKVMKPGGRIIFFEQMASPSIPARSTWEMICTCGAGRTSPEGSSGVNRHLTYPLPWATGPDVSHCATPQEYTHAFMAAGFLPLPELEEDRTAQALEFFSKTQSKMMWHFISNFTLTPPPLFLHILVGSDFKTKLSNYKAAVASGQLVVMELAFAKPVK